MASRQEYAQEDDQLFTLGYGKMNDPASRGLQNTQVSLAHVEYEGGKSKAYAKGIGIEINFQRWVSLFMHLA